MPTSFALDSPVRTSLSPGLAPALPVPVRDSSGKWFEPFAWFDPASSCWRTWQRCLVEGWTLFSGSFPRSGMTRNGIAYQRAPLVRLTDATESGLLPTPEASNTKAVALRSAGRSPRNFLAPWPTPKAMDSRSAGPGTKDETILRRASTGFGLNLAETVQALERGLWPTPTARATRDSPSERRRNSPSLESVVKQWPTPRVADSKGQGMSRARADKPDSLSAQLGGQLNPTWVELLMGFPPGWTDLT